MPKTTNPCAVVIDGTQCDATTEILNYCRFHWRQQNRGAAFTPRRLRRARHLGLLRDAQGRKQCARCGDWKALSLYGPATKTRDGLQSWCSPCNADYMTLGRYGITRADVLAMVEKQGGCALCGCAEPRDSGFRNGWHVDHDHACCPGEKTCGKCIRGVLCSRCNKLLGLADDSIERLKQAVAYLRMCEAKHEAVS